MDNSVLGDNDTESLKRARDQKPKHIKKADIKLQHRKKRKNAKIPEITETLRTELNLRMAKNAEDDLNPSFRLTRELPRLQPCELADTGHIGLEIHCLILISMDNSVLGDNDTESLKRARDQKPKHIKKADIKLQHRKKRKNAKIPKITETLRTELNLRMAKNAEDDLNPSFRLSCM
ncbi:unnamed protein product [Orchesella dallaii]|uniref:Ribosome biogenesis protein NOP53 n=1 Tax=Orchesella dallaii TaxID=48710 RepID=A0ABP1RLJ5_9HEXA